MGGRRFQEGNTYTLWATSRDTTGRELVTGGYEHRGARHCVSGDGDSPDLDGDGEVASVGAGE